MQTFSSQHFALLREWQGRKYDRDSPDHQRAYQELKTAYDLTKQWADGVVAALFPSGTVTCRRRPTNQGNNFERYNWARIYPTKNAPERLAYTVGIDAEGWFVVKIDTVHLSDNDPIRKKYAEMRGTYDNASPIVAMLSVADGVDRPISDLVAWSVGEIDKFSPGYDELAKALGLGSLDDEEILRRFDGKAAFKNARASWTPQETELFCRLARLVHERDLDWWHIDTDVEVRFGRKEPGSERATGVLGTVQGRTSRTLSLRHDLGELSKFTRQPVTAGLVTQLEAALSSSSAVLLDWAAPSQDRAGYWPDEASFEKAEGDVESERDDSRPSAKATSPSPRNIIYYGPPGTGKTFAVRRLIEADYQETMATHDADEWRRSFIAEKFSELRWWEAIAAALYDLQRPSKVTEIRDHQIIRTVEAANNNNHVPSTIYRVLASHAIAAAQGQAHAPIIFEKSENALWSLAGEWNEACGEIVKLVDELRRGPPAGSVIKRYEFVTFHQSYGYEEFVEGLRPLLDREGEGSGVAYRIRPGVFRVLCEAAKAAPDHRFAIVIDEINRGNISKIFGELITLIEVDKRRGMKQEITVTLPYSGDKFSVPANVDIIGTMNTADRSLALLDTALRRRFDFKPVYPDSRDEAGAPLQGLRVRTEEATIDIPQMLSAINERIEALYDRDHTIGHAYFERLKDCPDGLERFEALSAIFRANIVPLLEEYFFEDWQKIRLVLGDNQKEPPAQFVAEVGDAQEEYRRLFGVNSSIDSFAAKPRFALQPGTFSMPSAYVGIYKIFR